MQVEHVVAAQLLVAPCGQGWETEVNDGQLACWHAQPTIQAVVRWQQAAAAGGFLQQMMGQQKTRPETSPNPQPGA